MKPSRERDEIIEHWYSLVAGQQFPSADFYASVEEEIAAQQVPGLQISRVDLSEGGVLSDKREYLRLARERLRFDVCAAPVGVNYFFSFRFYALRTVVQPWEMLIAILVAATALYLASRFMGFFLGPVVLAATLAFFVWLGRNAIGLGLRDLDATLLRIPVVSPLYERYLRKDTFYREDMRLAYGQIVSAIVKREVETLTAAKGVQLLREYAYSPIFDGLYKVKERPLTAADAGAAPHDREV